jgi:hypothetical protein
MRLVPAIIALALVFVLASAPRPAAAASPLNRPEDPVVLTGADLPQLTGTMPADIVAFRYSGGWQQIPVQVDERFSQNFTKIYNATPPPFSSTNISELVYADPNTYAGPDPNPAFDSDDELAFMAKDAGTVPPGFSEPAHVVHNSGLQLTVTDPLDASAEGRVFLFKQDGTLDPGAGQSYVTYNFDLLSGNYKTTYDLATGPNPENSTVSTPYYAEHFGDRWQEDALEITTGGATGVDILDRHKALFAPGNCGRSEDTFDSYGGYPGPSNFAGEGAFIVNKNGPVRAIRAYLGANSGPNTERVHVFYAQRQDDTTYLRVHPIPSVMDFFDYSPAASGMTYYNDLNTGGVTIDGVPDAVAAGAPHWEMVTGGQGSLVMSGLFVTNIPSFSYTSYYEDNKTNPTTQCTGDAFAYGSSGPYVNVSLPSTDPGLGSTSFLNTTRVMYYEAPGLTTSDAAGLDARARAPLAVSSSAWSLGSGSVGGSAQVIDPATLPARPASHAGLFTLLVGAVFALLGGAIALRARARR